MDQIQIKKWVINFHPSKMSGKLTSPHFEMNWIYFGEVLGIDNRHNVPKYIQKALETYLKEVHTHEPKPNRPNSSSP